MAPISPDNWQRLESFFDRLLDLEPVQRASWLADQTDLCEADREQLRDLLRAHEQVGDSLETPLPQAAPQLVAAGLTDPLIGQTLGAFQVGEEIGRGGMGVVYVGRRVDGDFSQEVVIKVLRLGVDSEDTRRRFLQERQILADLDHPAIVRLLDGGFAPDGRPYIVMNRVMGQRIDGYCDRHKLPLRARVRLFLGVIEAVDYAHRHLIIHRDLKPSNVWVDEEGKVHLLDFGIAKIVDEENDLQVTMAGHRLLTPEYASPEQIRQEQITTASDVYQLGVLLYQLLTGQYPYDLSRRTPLEIEKRICDTDPIPASRAVTSVVATAAAAALNQAEDYIFTSRRADPGQLRKELRGDLELILNKALRKEPVRRYLAAHEMREDLIRWLNGDRILARPDSPGYQLRRFVRRHPLGVTLMATLLVSGAGFTVFHVQRITAERDVARQESAQRKEVSDFLVNLLKVPDPTTAQGREITARELIEVSVPGIEEQLSDPATKIRMYEVIGEVASNLGLYDQAGPALAQVVDHTAALYGQRSLETALAKIRLADLLRLSRNYQVAIVPAEDALAIRRELLPAGDVDIGRVLRLVAVIHRELRRFELAETELREAFAILEAGLPADDQTRVTIRTDLAYVLRTVGKVDEAEALYREAIPVMRDRSVEFGQALPGALNNLAFLLRKQDRFAEAEGLYREAIERNEGYFGEAHPSTRLFRNNLAGVLQHLGKASEARQELMTVIALSEHLDGPDHWRTGAAHRSLGICFYQDQDYASAVVELSRAYDNFKQGLGPDHRWTALAALRIATCHHLLGENGQAEEFWRLAKPVLATDDARADRNTQHSLDRICQHLPQGSKSWRRRVTELMALPPTTR